MKLLDNSCLSLFICEVPQYNFLKELYDLEVSLNTTMYVKNEFNQKINHDEIFKNMISVSDIDYDEQLKKRYPMLGNGELSIIQWGLMLKDKTTYQCILDDLNARKVASGLGLSLSGSIGLIIWLKNKNNYSDEKINKIIQDIDESNFRVSSKVLSKLRALNG